MSYHTYVTAAFVLGSHDAGEGSRTVILYTYELGLLYAVAKSVREARSKLRYGLQHLSLSDVSLVRGKDVWRITGAKERFSYYHRLADDRQRQMIAARVFLLLRRLIRGEEPHRELFTFVEGALEKLALLQLSSELKETFECLLVLSILNHLGYGTTSPLLENVGYTTDLSERELIQALPQRRKLIQLINKSLEASQL